MQMRVLAFHIVLLVCVLLVSKPSAVSADDGTAPTFDGFYIGGHVGGAFGDARWTNGPANFLGPAGSGGNLDPEGFIAGGQLGYMFQFNNFVIGADASISASDAGDTIASPLFPAFFTWTSDIEHVALLQARVGWTIDRWLVFAQGGYAGGLGAAQASTTVVAPPNSALSRKWHNGWTIGGGIKYKLDELFTFGAEYNYVDLGNETYNPFFTNPDLVNIDHKLHVFKVTTSLSIAEFFRKGQP